MGCSVCRATRPPTKRPTQDVTAELVAKVAKLETAIASVSGTCATVDFSNGGKAADVVISSPAPDGKITFEGVVGIGAHPDVAASLDSLRSAEEANLRMIAALEGKNAALEEKNAALEGKNAAQDARIKALEDQIEKLKG